jgi:glycosyltransferase involved in cell wall biosynthesis
MLTAGLGLTGTPIKMMDVIENINPKEFDITVAYKPDIPECELDFLNDLKSLGINSVPLRGKALFSLNGLLDLYKHVRKERRQIVHCWDALEIVARIIKLVTRCRVIMSYCNPVIDQGSSLYFIVNKITSFLTDGVIFCSQSIKSSYQRHKVLYLNNSKITIIQNCINISKIKKKFYHKEKIRKRYQISNSDIVLTNIGYFNKQKGQIYLIKAMNRIIRKKPEAKLILVGWGPLENKLRKKAQELGVEDKILFAGKCQRSAVLEILSITDIFVLSSLWEGFGRVMGEAMAMGSPVVATKTDGSELLVEHNKTGLTVPTKNAQLLADAVIELIDNPHRRLLMGKLGKEKISTFFSADEFIRQHENFYRKVLQAK